jgi:hypothetical protein
MVHVPVRRCVARLPQHLVVHTHQRTPHAPAVHEIRHILEVRSPTDHSRKI